MPTLDEVAARKVQHLMLFGDPKSGKTELAGTLAYIFDCVVWISIDNGHEVLFKLPKEQQHKILLIKLPDTKEFPVATDTCLKIVSGAECNICVKHGQVRCATCVRNKETAWDTINVSTFGPRDIIVFDHVSQLADSSMNFIMKNKALDVKPGWDEYWYQGAIMSKFFSNIQQAPYNLVCIAHTCETEMEDGSKKLVPLVGTVPFSRNVGKYFDHIIYCRVANRKHNFGSATTYLASVLTGSRGDIILEAQDKKNEESMRPTLLPFFEGKYDDTANKEPAPRLEEIRKQVEAVPDALIMNDPEPDKVSEVLAAEEAITPVAQQVAVVETTSQLTPVSNGNGGAQIAAGAKSKLAEMREAVRLRQERETARKEEGV